ncbi:MAG: hypothetical protein JWR72_332 [Flavisolibacter sp.]|jgi:hypothetical protein|nr:hypothetical protein [Flavisolibacter sp.]
MIQTANEQTTQKHPNAEVKIYSFLREDGRWYINLTEFENQGWTKNDLELVDGGHKLLNKIAHGMNKVTLQLSTEPFDGADVLELVDQCEAPKGGGIYLMESCRGEASFIWICDIALLVFGDMPDTIYVRRVDNLIVMDKANQAQKNLRSA